MEVSSASSGRFSPFEARATAKFRAGLTHRKGDGKIQELPPFPSSPEAS
ncbi:MAG: hypothetical protein SFW62_00660 [Alphaproteobacteria bacterium]|nr:hypothetical protein [Alphaproteobacteria bacterium]